MDYSFAVNRIISCPFLPGDDARRPMSPSYRPVLEHGSDQRSYKEAAVLVLLVPGSSGLCFPLIQRPSGPGVHDGQVSLPGGSLEPGESYADCALREAKEELGIDPSSVKIIRQLSTLPVPPSRFLVYPFVGIADERSGYAPSSSEVAGLFEPSLDELLDSSSVNVEESELYGQKWRIPFYRLAGLRVWGATAMILAELAAILNGTFSFGKGKEQEQ
ncbi:CoA pyrophosphatase [Spirochaetota bacterium]